MLILNIFLTDNEMKKWKYIKYILKYIIYNITLKCQTRGKKSSKYIFFIFRICPIKKNPLKKIFQKNNPSSSGWRVGMMLSYIIKLYYIVIFLEKCNLWNSSYWLNFESFLFEKPPLECSENLHWSAVKTSTGVQWKPPLECSDFEYIPHTNLNLRDFFWKTTPSVHQNLHWRLHFLKSLKHW